ncbi:DMT family transporter [Microbacterium imperiale]|uniref:Membrane protein n=1 Tax=Microbacterium imperiale TaxID=33884 RepID=A0A9W6HG89_9MICO|nr:DMT family transporter [Microbacterium imperiale]MBP2419430.1 drug/metabolite transporter (DMT)-like permease [Microbacterium imperiale]MDS0198700.1 DMT family transporter [Microbacterium imperiale]BFE39772.1 EamA family transporter [Microbacterium imperiale]GLJ79253.1 membrane protein [Microbacterium imperiale]
MTNPTAPLPIIAVADSADAPAASSAGRRTIGMAMAVASALAFSSSGPLVKPLLEAGWSLGAALFVRIATAALVLSPFLVRAIVRDRGILRRHGGAMIAFGLMPVVGCQLFYFSAMQRMPVAVALLIQYLAPVLLVLWVWLRTRRRPSNTVIAGSVVAMIGLVLVVDIAGARFDFWGTLLALGAALCTCVYFVMAERTGDTLAPIVLAAGGMVVAATFIAVLLGLGLLPLAVSGGAAAVLGAELPPLAVLLFVGLATGTAYALGVSAVPRTGSRLASFIGLSEVLFALGFAWLLLAEAPAPVQFAGGALILVGVVLVRLDADGAPPITRPIGSAAAMVERGAGSPRP